METTIQKECLNPGKTIYIHGTAEFLKSSSKLLPTNASRVAYFPYQFETLIAFTMGEYVFVFFTPSLYYVEVLDYFCNNACTLKLIKVFFLSLFLKVIKRKSFILTSVI